MSGGALDYISYRIDEVAQKVPDRELRELTVDFASLLHELEWYLSCDTSEEDWNKERDKFKKKWFGNRNKRLERIIEDSVQELKNELVEMIGKGVQK